MRLLTEIIQEFYLFCNIVPLLSKKMINSKAKAKPTIQLQSFQETAINSEQHSPELLP